MSQQHPYVFQPDGLTAVLVPSTTPAHIDWCVRTIHERMRAALAHPQAAHAYDLGREFRVYVERILLAERATLAYRIVAVVTYILFQPESQQFLSSTERAFLQEDAHRVWSRWYTGVDRHGRTYQASEIAAGRQLMSDTEVENLAALWMDAYRRRCTFVD